MLFSKWVKARRLALGYTQAQLSEMCGLGRTNLAAIENGKRTASTDMKRSIARCLAAPPSKLLPAYRTQILALAQENGISNIRVFGSIARNEDTIWSDIDLLVTLPEHNKALHLFRFSESLQRIIPAPLDVLSDNTAVPNKVVNRALREAVVL